MIKLRRLLSNSTPLSATTTSIIGPGHSPSPATTRIFAMTRAAERRWTAFGSGSCTLELLGPETRGEPEVEHHGSYQKFRHLLKKTFACSCIRLEKRCLARRPVSQITINDCSEGIIRETEASGTTISLAKQRVRRIDRRCGFVLVTPCIPSFQARKVILFLPRLTTTRPPNE